MSGCHVVVSSDHLAVICRLDMTKPPQRPVFRTLRELGSIDKEQLRADVASLTRDQPDATLGGFSNTLRSLLDVHAPATRRKVVQRWSSAWL